MVAAVVGSVEGTVGCMLVYVVFLVAKSEGWWHDVEAMLGQC